MAGTRGACALGAVLGAFVAISSAAARPLAEEVEGLLAAHPQIQAARNQHAAAGEAVGSARSAYWPTLSLTGNTGTDYVDSPDRRANSLDPYQHGRNQITLSLTQRLFDGFAREAGVDAARQGEEAAASMVDATLQTVLLEALTAYVDVLRQTRLLALSHDNERNVRTQLQLEDERVRRGSGMAVDVLQAKHRLQVAKERRIAVEGALRNAVSRYVQVFGHAPAVDKMEEPVPRPGTMPASLDEALRAARRDNPALLSGARQIEAAAARTRIAEGGWWPSFDLVGRGNLEKDRDATIGIRRDWSALVQMNWELFSGFRTDALVAQSTFDRAALIDGQDHALRKTEEATRLAWSTLQVARERLDVLESAVDLALEVWDMRKRLREAGKATVLDVLDAESDTVTARMTEIVAHFDERVAAFQVLQAMGRLHGAAALDPTPAARVTAPAPAPAPATEPPAPAPAPRPPVTGGDAPATAVQFAAVPTAEAAEREKARLLRLLGASLGGDLRVVPAKGLFRVTSGPLTDGAAADLCAEARRKGQDCFLRRPPAAAGGRTAEQMDRHHGAAAGRDAAGHPRVVETAGIGLAIGQHRHASRQT